MTAFAGLVAVVTGGSSGIGAAVVRRLRSAGARVAVFDVDPGAADADLALRVDVADAASVDAAVAAVETRLGRSRR